ncbi:hypothetical protein SLEP1_g6986 [Rubroshorea leprosula]|uniref:Uncharacterized protein n=1 Tax=Rubroshorea leprosula TaxID=152421 RepID=A0AAV5I585_9ROSI|nr:hypothetical protein SLEP1_g6986 [Rubroshorea leprosula]
MVMVLGPERDLSFPYLTSVRGRFGPDPSFLATGNLERELRTKQVGLALTEDEKHQLQKMVDQDTKIYIGGILSHCWLWCMIDFIGGL